MGIIVIIYVLALIIVALIVFSIMQIKVAGMNVKDFAEFIQANQILDDLYEVTKKYERMDRKRKISIFNGSRKSIFSFWQSAKHALGRWISKIY